MSEKKFWYKIEDSLYDEEEEEDFRRIRSHVKNEIEEEKEEKYVQLEFEFDEDLVAPI
jgi:predicted Co/Zn/Cd cation transporter (cation efflux family)